MSNEWQRAKIGANFPRSFLSLLASLKRTMQAACEEKINRSFYFLILRIGATSCFDIFLLSFVLFGRGKQLEGRSRKVFFCFILVALFKALEALHNKKLSRVVQLFFSELDGLLN